MMEKLKETPLVLWLVEAWAMIRHVFILSWVMSRLLVRYSYVIFREILLEIPIAKEKLSALHRKTAHEFVHAAMDLKGGLIKVGQFLSARADVVPAEIVSILGQLQDRVTPAPYTYVAETFFAAFGESPETVFASFSREAVAAASLGQVHRATTKEGEAVMVKILHHNIKRSLAVDLTMIRIAAFLLGRLFSKFNIERMVDEIVEVTKMETDYTHEAKSAERVRQNLLHDTRVRVPRVIWKYCRPTVLCLEDITGARIDDLYFIKQSGGSVREVLTAVISAYAQQIYVDGFFQCDPHPGNLFYYPPRADGTPGPLVGIIDFGQSKEIPMEVHHNLRRAVLAVIQRDEEGFLAAMVNLSVLDTAELPKVRGVVQKLGAQLKTGSASEVMSMNFEALARDVVTALRDLDALTLPNDLILYGRTLGLLHGLAFKLDPDLPIFEVAAPYLMRFAFG